MKVSDTNSLCDGFLKSVQAFGNRPAVEVSGEVLTYAGLFEKAASLAATLIQHQVAGEPPLTAVFAYRSVTAFAGVLAALLRGHGYVPLNRTFPPQRTVTMLQRSECRAMIVDAESEKQLDDILERIDHEIVLILPEQEEARELAARWPQHRFVSTGEFASPEQWRPLEVSLDSIAYLMFTSGSTGTPKGVMVSHHNVLHYTDWTVNRYHITEQDRVSQNFDMTFDLSVHDMFAAWERGACVCCPSQKTLINPGRFIVESKLSTWFSVPSTAVFMKRLGMLKPDMYPNLRLSLFCGEALPMDIAKDWSKAAPSSVIENIYGPTELTIGCTAYRWDRDHSAHECECGLVPIGEPFAHMEALIVNEDLEEVPIGTPGELLMTGPQLTLGYWREPDKTAHSFIVPPGTSKTYYRTGDRVRRPLSGKPLVYLGRVDNQIKVLGHRVELGEVEAALREESGIDSAIAVGWPILDSGAGGIEAFLQTEGTNLASLRDRLSKRLPSYMVPRRIHLLTTIPLNSNGKYDRRALFAILEQNSNDASK